MAISCEKVYSGVGDQVYPETADKAVTVLSKNQTLDIYLEALEKQISNIQGADQVAQSLKFKVDYLATNISDINKIKELESNEETNQWGENFQLPSVQSPYIWKRTIIYFQGQDINKGQKFYEIVTADIAEISQTLYMVKDNSQQPKIFYPQKAVEVEGEMQNVDDTNASIDEVIKASELNNNNWSKQPSEITASNPYGFMAVRSRVKGSWGIFKVALYSKWSYDSRLIMKYTVTSTSDKPQVSRTSTNPGNQWQDTNETEFTGYLWMVSASSNNNNYVMDSDKNIWSTPQLISIVK